MYVDPNIGAILLQGLVAIVLGGVYRFRRVFSRKWLRRGARAEKHEEAGRKQ